LKKRGSLYFLFKERDEPPPFSSLKRGSQLLPSPSLPKRGNEGELA
jgi:hypothetical protein